MSRTIRPFVASMASPVTASDIRLSVTTDDYMHGRLCFNSPCLSAVDDAAKDKNGMEVILKFQQPVFVGRG